MHARASLLVSTQPALSATLHVIFIHKMRYEGESRSWNWDKHCSKFHMQIRVIDELAADGKAKLICQQ